MGRRQKIRGFRSVIAVIFILVACIASGDESSNKLKTESYFYKVDPNSVNLKHSCSVYVPAYSHIYLSKDHLASLGVTLSIRNVDSSRKLYITQVEYYDTQGTLTDMLTAGLFALAPMATISYVIDQQDMRGGVGANFIVRWAAENPIHPPIIEAIMAGNAGTKGYSFSSRGENISCND